MFDFCHFLFSGLVIFHYFSVDVVLIFFLYYVIAVVRYLILLFVCGILGSVGGLFVVECGIVVVWVCK